MNRLTNPEYKELGFHSYTGEKNPYNSPLTLTELSNVSDEYSPKKILEDVFLKLAKYEDLGYEPEELRNKIENKCASLWKTFSEEQPLSNVQVFVEMNENTYIVGSFSNTDRKDCDYITFHTNSGKHKKSLKDIKWMSIPE